MLTASEFGEKQMICVLLGGKRPSLFVISRETAKAAGCRSKLICFLTIMHAELVST